MMTTSQATHIDPNPTVIPFATDLFDFYMPSTIYFGQGKRQLLGKLASNLGKRPLIIAGQRASQQAPWFQALCDDLSQHDLSYQVFADIEPDPTDETVIRGVTALKAHNADCLIAIGGGSVMDAAKAIALVALQGGSPLDYAGIESDLPILPVLCVPTTAGTGSEVTKYAVIRNAQTHKKVTIKNKSGFPAIAIVDPELTRSMPAYVTVCTGVDASIHALEAFLSKESNWMTDALALDVLRRVFAALPRATSDPEDMELRASLHYAAMVGGIIINNVRTGIIHTMGNHLGAMTHLPHGHSLAVLTLDCLRFNAAACADKFKILQAVLQLPGDNPAEAVVEGFTRLFNLAGLAQLPPDSHITPENIETMVENVCKDTRLFSINPMPLTAQDIREIYETVVQNACQ